MSDRSLMIDSIETKPTLRRRIIEAADALIREQGLSGATTREIARAAGCAEGSIYVHFEDKIDLVIAVIVEREPSLRGAARAARRRPARARSRPTSCPGRRSSCSSCATTSRSSSRSWATATSSPASRSGCASGRPGRSRLPGRRGLRARGAGARPHRRRVEPEVVASILIGACRDQRRSPRLWPAPKPIPRSGFARELVQTIVYGLADARCRRHRPSEEEPVVRARILADENRKWWTLGALAFAPLHDHARQHGRERRAAVDPARPRHRPLRARVDR